MKTNKTPRTRNETLAKPRTLSLSVCSSPKHVKTEYSITHGPISDTQRLPNLFAGLKTCPGGNRWAGLFDNRVLDLWTLLANQANAGNDYVVTVNVSTVADRLAVHRHTVQRWLKFFQRNGLLELTRQAGGRCQGVRVFMTWVKVGDERAQLRCKREVERGQRTNVNPESVSVPGETVPQGPLGPLTKLRFDGQPHHDDHVRGPGHARYVLFKLRQAVKCTGLNPQQKETILSQLARWVWRKTLSLSQLRRVHSWVLEQAGRCVSFTGRALISWLLRGLHGVVQWARSRVNVRATSRVVADLERSDRAARAVEVEPEVYAQQLAEVRAALRADGWVVPATW